MLTLKRANSTNPDFQNLVRLLDQDLKIRDGEDHDFYHQFNKTDALKNTIIAYLHDQPVGCGAFKNYDPQTVEIKRMFVHPDFRGQGIASGILKELEAWASELNYAACILETGKNQPEAIALYQKVGYTIIPNYGQYAAVENSVCMRKTLTRTPMPV